LMQVIRGKALEGNPKRMPPGFSIASPGESLASDNVLKEGGACLLTKCEELEPIFVPIPDPDNLKALSQLVWNSAYNCNSPILTFVSSSTRSSSRSTSACSDTLDTSSEFDFVFENQYNNFIPIVAWNREVSHQPRVVGQATDYPQYFPYDSEYTTCFIGEDGSVTPIITMPQTSSSTEGQTGTPSGSPAPQSKSLSTEHEETSEGPISRECTNSHRRKNLPSRKKFKRNFNRRSSRFTREGATFGRERSNRKNNFRGQRRNGNIYLKKSFDYKKGFDPNNPPRPYDRNSPYLNDKYGERRFGSNNEPMIF